MNAIRGYTETKLVDPFEIFVGPVFEKHEDGKRRFAFLVDDRHVNLRGVLHGGMLMTFADLALGAAVWDATDFQPCVTLNMQTHFLRPAKAGDIVEVAPELTRQTKSMVFMRGDFLVAREIIMTAASIWRLLPREQGA